ncbi:cytochrome P450 [Phaeosphaeriaceae sp. PMI808]|nr:cytochrome P450 [Phaeosphaeriaceae sp. PMI808]
MAILNITIFIIGVYLITSPIVSLWRNYRSARKTGLRLLFSPVTPYTVQWQLSASYLQPLLYNFSWFRAIDWTCAWQDGAKLHDELGHCFIVVSPGLNVLCTSDAKTIEHVLKKWRDFVKPDNVNEILGTFGQNVDTSNGEDWTRHRKLTASCFTERASSTVWTEALRQCEPLLAKLLSSQEKYNNSIIKDTSTLALNVISSVAFENHQVNEPTDGHTLSLREALLTVMSTSISPALSSIMPWLSSSGLQTLLPPSIKQLLTAMREFRGYMDEIIVRERAKSITVADAKPTLISTLLRANHAANQDTKARLSDIELRGNMFIFTVGGLESTAITLSYALALLAMNPEIQDWVTEEVDEVMRGKEDVEYAKAFPKLNRVMCIMVLRNTSCLLAFSPLPRSFVSPHSAVSIPISSNGGTCTSSITLPPSTQLSLNSWASHVSHTYFPSPNVFRPQRWLSDTNTVLHPTSESGFLAWGAGPRVCPGMKFSQVEFCAVLARLMSSVKVTLDDSVGKSREQEKKRLAGVLRDSIAEPLLLHVRRPGEVKLKIVKR